MIAAMRAGTDTLVDLGAYQYGGRNLADDSSDPQHVMVGTLTTNILGILGVEPAFGRGFAPEDGLEGAERVVLLDQGLWPDNASKRHVPKAQISARLSTGRPRSCSGIM